MILRILTATLAALAMASPTTTATASGQHGEQGIIGGEPAKQGDFPEMVKLRLQAPKYTFNCGATQLTPDTILTAAHCVQKPGASDGGKFLKVTAYFGNVEWKKGEAVNVTIGNWTGGKGSHKSDWAVVKLDHAPKTQAFVTIATDATLDTSPRFTALGWGSMVPELADDGKLSPPMLRRVDVPLHTGKECAKTAAVEICASGNGESTKNKDTCGGDSGGPLFANRGGARVQVGITSWGMGCGRADHPGHYAKVSAFSKEILAAVAKVGGKPRP